MSCSSTDTCPFDAPCQKATCANGCCGTEPDHEGDACGSTGGGGNAAQSTCKAGVCAGCKVDGDCPGQTPCKTWTCDALTEVCKSTNVVSDSLLKDAQVEGDCYNATCVEGTLVLKGMANADDTPKPPSGMPKPCEIWGCDSSFMPIQGQVRPAGFECGASTCGLAANGAEYEQTTTICDGVALECQPPQAVSCGLFACDPATNKCGTTCAVDNDCLSFNFCNAGICEAIHPDGDPCSGDNACQHGHCVDMVCCDTVCNGVCQSCNLEGSPGTCTNVAAGMDPFSECTSPQVCDGAGACGLPDGKPCASAGACANGNCVDGYCCNNACNTKCKACNVAGKEGTCSSIPAGTDPDTECTVNANAAAVCNGSGACKLPDAETCFGDGDCLNGHCEDKILGVRVCCNIACGTCKSCRQTESGQPDGTCGNEANGTICGAGKTCTNGNCL